ncbi:alpha/beta hydrolase [Camelliibacillus cellulosilyticus]|uniref:Alpha/beta hydrolase n=1 Tax=Camelliibacillus cellulosilyticus TaxID=2174486 RepID=A0ABV9GMH5_9BACL
MKSKTFTIKADDDYDLFAYQWLPEKMCTGVVQISHGMAEHAGRYHRFAEALAAEGFAVYGHDHRGHGGTAKTENEKGHLADVNGWERAVLDLKQVTEVIKDAHPEAPFFLFGHSMGSFLARRYIQKFGDGLNGVILSGTGANPGLLGHLGLWLTKHEIKTKGLRTKSERMNRLIFGGYNRRFKPVRTAFDWLSSDDHEVDRYIADPDCGFVPTAGFFYDLLTGLMTIERESEVQKVPKSMPILLVSGKEDPVGGFMKGVLKVYHQYKRAGCQDVMVRFYEGARHELLNEKLRNDVTRDIVNWIYGHVKKKTHERAAISNK